MALKDLSIEAMVQVTESWLNPKELRPLLEALPLVKPLLPRLEQRLAALIQARAETTPTNTELDDLNEEARSTDGHYDRKARGLNHVLLGLSLLSDDPAEAAEFDDMRGTLLPDGLKVTQMTYREEAGAITLLEQRWTPAHQQKLALIPTPWGTLDQKLDQWKGYGRRLGEVENRRDQLTSQLANQPANPEAPEKPESLNAHRARNGWIKTARNLERMVDDSDASDDVTEQIFGGLRKAEAKAVARRQAAARGPKDPKDS